ncbi:putative SAM-dependent methyltransferase [Neorhizobium sp. 2083]|uniref:class I SAM-dependent methyltransferase n=1 Tax=Neorhizobium sp. 2083 TaxID=2817762 RepID=UPI00286228FC|nr:class I SAM-dependent methyltransferase [Neorhizobium sp. 2083]MDR6816446.1 putative SAM-dependent methyltransferase [Neorhizobium sp. 2083]
MGIGGACGRSEYKMSPSVSLNSALTSVRRRLQRKYQRVFPPAKVEMTESDEIFLLKNVNFNNMTSAENFELLSPFSIQSRERFAIKTKSLVLYTADEAEIIMRLEEEAALRAAPSGYSLKQLNGVNIGCGDRRVSEYLTPVDIMREELTGATGTHHAFLKDAILANPEDLPFKERSLDYIVALHMLEHVANPMEILRYWATILKPGGGIGLILPNYEYTWNAIIDDSKYGHKWNSSPSIFEKLYWENLSDLLQIEQLATLEHKISFDVILRKPGDFKPFAISNLTSPHSGAELAKMNIMVSEMLDR